MRRLLIAFALLLAVSAQATAEDARGSAIAAHAVADYIQPATARFAADAGRLNGAVAGYCTAGGRAKRAPIDTAFRAAVTSWSGIQFLRFGPLVEGRRLERIAYWPDPKGVGLRQIRKAVASRDRSVADPARLAGKSVALQGLTALEYLLYADDGNPDRFRCEYAAAAALSLADIASAVATEWADPDGFAERLLRPDDDDPLYRTPAEVLAELHRALSTGLQVVQDQKLKPMLGEDMDAARPLLAPFPYSGLGIAAIAADLSALQAFAAASGFTRDLPEQQHWLDGSMAFEFDNAIRAARAVTLPVDRAVFDPDARSRLDYLLVVLDSLRTMIRQDLAAALGLAVGFNALDGD